MLAALVALAGCAHLGDTCSDDDDCGGDLVCARPNMRDGSLAAEGVCTEARLGRGETCAASAECERELFCSNELPAEERQRFGTCRDPQASGAVCAADAQCAAGLACEDGTCAPAPATEPGVTGS